MYNRIKLIRKKEGLTQTKFGEKLGVSRDVIGNIEYGRVEPKPLLINHLCDVFNVNKKWILTGEGEMYSIPEDELKISNVLNEISRENSEIYPLVDKLLELDDDYFELVSVLIEKLLRKQKKQEK